ncbi:MAG: hypothetical protein ACLR7D_12730 [Lachnospira eligens]
MQSGHEGKKVSRICVKAKEEWESVDSGTACRTLGILQERSVATGIQRDICLSEQQAS